MPEGQWLVVIAGLVIGGVLVIGSGIWVWKKAEVTTAIAGLMMAAGFVLMTFSVWTTIKLNVEEGTIELTREKLEETAAAADEVAAQAEVAAQEAAVVRAELTNLLEALARHQQAPTGTIAWQIATRLGTAPKPDLTRLTTARARLRMVTRTDSLRGR